MRSDLGFEPVTRETLSSQIREQLLARITSGELAPGARVPSERDLSEQFGVARTSVREAMHGLVSIGAVERRGNRVYVVERLPEVVVSGGDDRKAFVRQLFETRRVLEIPIFQLAAERATVSERDRIMELAEQFRPGMELVEFRRLDRHFHTTIAHMCGNPLLIELYGKVLDRLFRSEEFDSLLSASENRDVVHRLVEESSADHTAIAAAFQAEDPVAVLSSATHHLGSVERQMVEKLV